MPYPYYLPFRPSGPAWGLFPQAEPFGQPLNPLAASLVKRQAPGLVHIVQHVSLANGKYANLVYQDSVLSLGRRCKAVASQTCLDLSPDAALPKVLPVTESLANLVRVSGHVILDNGLDDRTGIAQGPPPLVIATAAFHRDSQVSGNGHQHGLEDGHFLDLLASVGIGGRIDLPAHGLNGLLPLNFSLAQVEHGGRRGRQNVLAKGVASHCNIPFQFVPWLSPPGKYRILHPGGIVKKISIFFEIFFPAYRGRVGRQEMEINLPPGWVLRIATFCFFWA